MRFWIIHYCRTSIQDNDSMWHTLLGISFSSLFFFLFNTQNNKYWPLICRPLQRCYVIKDTPRRPMFTGKNKKKKKKIFLFHQMDKNVTNNIIIVVLELCCGNVQHGRTHLWECHPSRSFLQLAEKAFAPHYPEFVLVNLLNSSLVCFSFLIIIIIGFINCDIIECWDEKPNARPSMKEVLARLENLDTTGWPDITIHNPSPIV